MVDITLILDEQYTR